MNARIYLVYRADQFQPRQQLSMSAVSEYKHFVQSDRAVVEYYTIFVLLNQSKVIPFFNCFFYSGF